MVSKSELEIMAAELETMVAELRPEEFLTIDAAILDLLSVSTSPPPPLLENNIQPQPGQSGGNGSSVPHDTTRMEYLDSCKILNSVESSSDNTLSDLVPAPSPTSGPLPPVVESGGYGSFLHQGAAPCMMANPSLYSGPQCSWTLYSQEGVYEQVQYLHYQRPTDAIGHPAAPTHKCNSTAMMMLPGGINKNLLCVGVLERNNRSHHEMNRPYVKKPPNAFMLFMKEERPNVDPQVRHKGSRAVNVFLGEKWASLTREEQARYFNEAEKQRLLHKQQHPEWSTSDNYGKKRKKGRREAPNRTEASTPEVTPQAKRLCVMAAPMMMTTQAPHTKPRVMKQRHLQTSTATSPMIVPMYHVYDVNSASWLAASPAPLY